MGGPVSELEKQISDLPARAGGLGWSLDLHDLFYILSSAVVVQAAISGQAEFSSIAYLDTLDTVSYRASAVIGEHIQYALLAKVALASSSIHGVIERVVD